MKTKHKPQTKVVLICILHFIASRAAAIINVREGSFAQTSVDLDRSQEHDDLKIERTYNSRSSHNGIFGFGWCSPFEARLREAPGGKLALQECANGNELIFETSPVKPDQWLATNASAERLLLTRAASPGRLMRRTGRGEIQTFSELSGRLIGITDRAGRILELRYAGDGRLIEAGAPGKKSLIFVYDDSGMKIVRVDSPGRTSVQYAYRGMDLVAVDGGQLSYEYDDLHNLMRIKTGERVTDEMIYDKDQDRLLRATRLREGGNGLPNDQETCIETLTYRAAKARLEVETSSQCGKRKPTLKHFEFWYRGETTRYLARMRVESDHRYTEFSFDPVYGQPTMINRNGNLARIAAGAQP